MSSPRTAGFGGELERRVGGAGGGLPLVILPQGRWFQGPEPPRAVVLAMRIGDARSRFTNARSLKAYAGSAPVTRASGKSLTVTHRRVKTNAWPPSATSEPSPRSKPHPAPERTRTDAKTTGDRHTAAPCNLFNRLLGCLRHCLQTRQHYNEQIAFPTTHTNPTKAAA
ncbi:MAG: sle [Pseudonocardiales bacterium]|nr:sle [Pseudonocardiales bacterium]